MDGLTAMISANGFGRASKAYIMYQKAGSSTIKGVNASNPETNSLTVRTYFCRALFFMRGFIVKVIDIQQENIQLVQDKTTRDISLGSCLCEKTVRTHISNVIYLEAPKKPIHRK
ncbi:hypothetical protein [Paenibacillus solani]|nr:hypothetical protein [Paenibacillus solani]